MINPFKHYSCINPFMLFVIVLIFICFIQTRHLVYFYFDKCTSICGQDMQGYLFFPFSSQCGILSKMCGILFSFTWDGYLLLGINVQLYLHKVYDDEIRIWPFLLLRGGSCKKRFYFEKKKYTG